MLLDTTREKQRWIIYAIWLFLIFDFSVLALNYWLSRKIEEDAVAINLAGRQRMLSQRMINSLLSIEIATQNGNEPKLYLNELQVTSKLFDDTLKGFRQRHLTYGGDNKPVYLESLRDATALTLLNKADKLWQPYHTSIIALLANTPNYQPNQLRAVVNYASEHNLQLLNLMNQLTSNLQDQTHKQAEQIRTYQGIAFLLALANFLGISFMYNRCLHEVSRNSLMLHNIIDQVAVCVLIIDADNLIIDSNYATQKLFQYKKSEIVGKKLAQLLEEHTDKTTATRKDGSNFIAEVERNRVKLDELLVTIITIADVTQQRQTMVRLNEIAYTDTLTGLPNRTLFDDRLNLGIQHARRENNLLAVLIYRLRQLQGR